MVTETKNWVKIVANKKRYEKVGYGYHPNFWPDAKKN